MKFRLMATAMIFGLSHASIAYSSPNCTSTIKALVEGETKVLLTSPAFLKVENVEVTISQLNKNGGADADTWQGLYTYTMVSKNPMNNEIRTNRAIGYVFLDLKCKVVDGASDGETVRIESL